jgi:hypothetical protein
LARRRRSRCCRRRRPIHLTAAASVGRTRSWVLQGAPARGRPVPERCARRIRRIAVESARACSGCNPQIRGGPRAESAPGPYNAAAGSSRRCTPCRMARIRSSFLERLAPSRASSWSSKGAGGAEDERCVRRRRRESWLRRREMRDGSRRNKCERNAEIQLIKIDLLTPPNRLFGSGRL